MMVSKIIESKNKPSNLLVIKSSGSDLSTFLLDYFKSILADTDPKNAEYWVDKLEKNTYFDIKIYDAKNDGLRKQDIVDLCEWTKHNTIESIGVGFFVIKNIEYANKQSLNSLLKFIEEPIENIYGVFMTKNIDLVLPTITSRCAVMVLQNGYDEKLRKLFLEKKIDSYAQDAIVKCYDDYDSIEKNIDSFAELYQLANKIVECIDNLMLIYKTEQLFFKLDYKSIKTVLVILQVKLKRCVQELSKLEIHLNVNPNKVLIFNKVIDIIKENNE